MNVPDRTLGRLAILLGVGTAATAVWGAAYTARTGNPAALLAALPLLLLSLLLAAVIQGRRKG